jgi:tRNA dimethylallyltransferase
MQSLDKLVSSGAIVVVCGPTASGKTHLGVTLARELGSEIVSVDSRQLYRGMDIGTGKDLQEYGSGQDAVGYHLIDTVDPCTIYTLWDFQRDFYGAARSLWQQGKVPVAVGGSGLYLEAVLKNFRIPNIPEDVALRTRLMQLPHQELIAQLTEIAPHQLPNTDCSTKKRVVRALEIAHYGLSHPIEWGHDNPPRFAPLVLGVRWERSVLRERIALRLQQRLQEGMVAEVQGLIARGVSRQRLELFGMEYRHCARHLFGEIDYQTMVDALYIDICQLAKRQDTWFRGMERRGIAVQWIDNAESSTALRLVRQWLDKG